MNMSNNSKNVLLLVSGCDGLFNTLNGHCVFWQDLVINAFVFSLGTCIIFTNIWIFWNLYSRRNHEDTSLVIMMNLAISDTFIGFMVIYDAIYNITQFSVYIECILRIGMFIFCSLSSGLIIMSLTFERLIKISNSYSYRKCITMTRTKIVLVFVWMTSLVVGLLPFFGWSSKNILYLCSFFRTMSDSYIVFVLTLHMVPFLCTFCAYLWMLVVVRRHVTAIKNVRSTAGRRTRGRSTSRAVITTLIVVGVYFLCWAPTGLFTLLVVAFEIDEHLPARWSADVLLTYLLVLAAANSIFNPLIYAFKLDIIRRQFRASGLFRCLTLCCKVNRRR